jgi:hypothetical protein
VVLESARVFDLERLVLALLGGCAGYALVYYTVYWTMRWRRK